MTPAVLDPRRSGVRAARAAVLTVPTVGMASVAHATGDGCGSLVAMGLAAGLTWPAAVALLGARRRVPALLAFAALAQVLTHVLLELACPEVVAGRVGLLQHLEHSATAPLLLAHLGALAVTAVLLSRADGDLWATHALLRAVRRSTGRRLLLPTLPVLPRLRVRQPVLLLRSLCERSPLLRRGPPALPC